MIKTLENMKKSLEIYRKGWIVFILLPLIYTVGVNSVLYYEMNNGWNAYTFFVRYFSAFGGVVIYVISCILAKDIVEGKKHKIETVISQTFSIFIKSKTVIYCTFIGLSSKIVSPVLLLIITMIVPIVLVKQEMDFFKFYKKHCKSIAYMIIAILLIDFLLYILMNLSSGIVSKEYLTIKQLIGVESINLKGVVLANMYVSPLIAGFSNFKSVFSEVTFLNLHKK